MRLRLAWRKENVFSAARELAVIAKISDTRPWNQRPGTRWGRECDQPGRRPAVGRSFLIVAALAVVFTRLPPQLPIRPTESSFLFGYFGRIRVAQGGRHHGRRSHFKRSPAACWGCTRTCLPAAPCSGPRAAPVACRGALCRTRAAWAAPAPPALPPALALLVGSARLPSCVRCQTVPVPILHQVPLLHCAARAALATAAAAEPAVTRPLGAAASTTRLRNLLLRRHSNHCSCRRICRRRARVGSAAWTGS